MEAISDRTRECSEPLERLTQALSALNGAITLLASRQGIRNDAAHTLQGASQLAGGAVLLAKLLRGRDQDQDLLDQLDAHMNGCYGLFDLALPADARRGDIEAALDGVDLLFADAVASLEELRRHARPLAVA